MMGKLHVLNNNLSNDRKFSSAIAGDYKAFPYISSKEPYSNAGNSLCTLFDENSKSFVRYFSQGNNIVKYGVAGSEAYVDPNNLPNIPLAILTYDYSKTCAIVKDEEGIIKAYLYNFLSEDDSDVSGNGSRSIIDLSNCENIDQATMFYSGPSATCISLCHK